MDIDEAVRFRRAIGRLARSFNASAAGEDVTPTQASVLGIVVALGPVPLATVVEVERLNPTMISRVVKALADLGLVLRSPGEQDQRTYVLTATPRGREVNAHIKDQRASEIREAAGRLTEQQHAVLLKALPALEALAGESFVPERSF